MKYSHSGRLADLGRARAAVSVFDGRMMIGRRLVVACGGRAILVALDRARVGLTHRNKPVGHCIPARWGRLPIEEKTPDFAAPGSHVR
jgi:hypothetical protein